MRCRQQRMDIGRPSVCESPPTVQCLSTSLSPVLSTILTGGRWARACQDSRLRGERRPRATLPRRFWGGWPSHLLPSLLRGATEGRKVGGGPHGGLTTAPFLKEGRPTPLPRENQPLLCLHSFCHTAVSPPFKLATCFCHFAVPTVAHRGPFFARHDPHWVLGYFLSVAPMARGRAGHGSSSTALSIKFSLAVTSKLS